MKNKPLAFAVLFFIFTSVIPQNASAGIKQAASSLALPTTGQAMNGQLGTTKTKIMAGVEVAAIATVAILGVASGGGVVWAGLGPLIANHLWSATDAYKNSDQATDPLVQQQMAEAQRTIDISRQPRIDGVDTSSNIRRRIQIAGEQAAY